MRVFNFSAGPSMLPFEVLQKAQSELTDYIGSGMSVLEMSHRSKWFEGIIEEAVSLIRELTSIPDDYDVLFLQGGASLQFEAVPLNLFSKGKADYVVTGNFAKKAFKEAQKYGDVVAAADSSDKNYTYFPKMDEVKFREDLDYIHFTANNTIFGSAFNPDHLPKSDATLVTDMSSCILTRVYDMSKFGLIYAGAQKNIGPAGVTLVMVKHELTNKEMPICPTMMKYSVQAKNNSLYNTPPCFSIYITMLNLRWLKKIGGVSAIEKINREKSDMIYSFIDNSGFYKNNVNHADRSIVNVPFVTPSEELDAKFIKEAAENGLVSLKGHRLVGGMRASMYNGMPIEGTKALVEFMKKFQLENKYNV